MATTKKLRTPIIKPRTQGGTFYTFGSAMEDIGLNINNSNNKVDLSHYVLLDIPTFGTNAGDLKLHTVGSYSDNIGDYQFAEYFQNAILNMETVLRNQDDYNYAAMKTVSERVFWKWLFKDTPDSSFIHSGKYYYENPTTAKAKAFGRIVSGSQRIDTYGIYNETFVQIPSSYGQMRVLFKPVEDENYNYDSSYYSTNNGIIEGIQSSELSGNTLIATGINGKGIFDNGNIYTSAKKSSAFEAELSIENLREYYGDENLTIDDIGFGNVSSGVDFFDRFGFNAILVYYSIYDSTGTNVLSTNAFGVYILDNAIETSNEPGVYYFPELTKIKTTDSAAGTSFSFRINIKPTSAYSGDITVSDNSTTAFSEAEDFNDVIKNLSRTIEILKTNARNLSEIAATNQSIKNLVTDALDKVDDIEKTVNAIKDSSVYDTLITNDVFVQNYGTLPYDIKSIANQILNKVNVTFDSNENISVTINTIGLSGDALKMAKSMIRKIDNKNYCDITKLVALMLATRSLTSIDRKVSVVTDKRVNNT